MNGITYVAMCQIVRGLKRNLNALQTSVKERVLSCSLDNDLLLKPFLRLVISLSSVSIVSGYGLDDRAIGVRPLAEAKGFIV
jgi:hypothetical protein